MRLVIIESPYAGTPAEIARNIAYARAAARDCLLKGEAPYLSHILYTQPGILSDGIADERRLGIESGLQWGSLADATVVYTDLGISDGMEQGIERAAREHRPVERRSLPNFNANEWDAERYRDTGNPWWPLVRTITPDEVRAAS